MNFKHFIGTKTNRKKILLVFFSLNISLQCLLGQESIKSDQSITKIPDTLLTKTFKQLDQGFNSNISDSIIAKLYAKTYLLKAKRNVDTIEIANGYNLHYKISKHKRALKYIDSIIELTKGIESKYYPSRGYLNKGVLLASEKKFSEALEFYLKAKQHAEYNKNSSHIIAVNHNIANLKKVLDKNEEALGLYKQNLNLLEKINNQNQYQMHYIATFDAIGDTYNRLKKFDSAKHYIKKGLLMSLKTKDTLSYERFLLSDGITSFFNENYNSAIDTLHKSEKLFAKSNINYAICNLYLGKTFYKLNQPKKAVFYLEKVDSLINPKNYIHESREAFQLLITHYKKTENHEKLLKTLQKLITLDSISKLQETDINTSLIKNYDSIDIINEKNELIDKLNNEQKTRKKWLWLLITILVTISVTFIIKVKKSKQQKTEFKKLIANLENQNKKDTIKANEKSAAISDHILKDLSEKLKEFENSNGFLDPDLNSNNLAAKFQTNVKYLSKSIKHIYDKNFIDYLNDLRINYAIDRIKNEPIFRNYTIKAIAEECGFKNPNSFSRAFVKITQIKPSVFIKNIEELTSNSRI